jgi:hypothetical protein
MAQLRQYILSGKQTPRALASTRDQANRPTVDKDTSALYRKKLPGVSIPIASSRDNPELGTTDRDLLWIVAAAWFVKPNLTDVEMNNADIDFRSDQCCGTVLCAAYSAWQPSCCQPRIWRDRCRRSNSAAGREIWE